LIIKENKFIKLDLSKAELIFTDIGSAGFKYVKNGAALGEETFLYMEVSLHKDLSDSFTS
jgi:hypothetical protein